MWMVGWRVDLEATELARLEFESGKVKNPIYSEAWVDAIC